MTTADLDLTGGCRDRAPRQGRQGPPGPFGPQTGRAIDRYLRMRRSHRLADTPALWLGDRGKGLGYDGLYSALRYRG